jgi:hypothetical protein
MGRRARPETGVRMPTALFSQAVMARRPVRLVQRRAEARELAPGRAVPLWRGMAWHAAALCCETAAVRCAQVSGDGQSAVPEVSVVD